MRLDRFLSNLKYGTRSEIQKAIKHKQVYVNDRLVIDSRYKIDPSIDKVLFNDQVVYYKESVLIMMNKPLGYLSANQDGKDRTVLEYKKGDADVDPSIMDLDNIVTHELGHSLGLGDLYQAECSLETMYGYGVEGEIQKRDLNAGDVAGISSLY